MDFFVISLERTPDRLKTFKRDNAGIVDFEVVSAVDGQALPPIDPSVADGTAAYTDSSMGCVLSHINLWRRVAASGRVATIMEDDAILNKNFKTYQEELISRASPDWDLILWGWNFDSILHVDLGFGLGQNVMVFDQNAMRKGAEDFQRGDMNSNLYKLRNAFGIMCYSISKKGAQKFLEKILPIRQDVVYFPGLKRFLHNAGGDVNMNKYYFELSCFACFPPLAIAFNDKGQSTISSPLH